MLASPSFYAVAQEVTVAEMVGQQLLDSDAILIYKTIPSEKLRGRLCQVLLARRERRSSDLAIFRLIIFDTESGDILEQHAAYNVPVYVVREDWECK